MHHRNFAAAIACGSVLLLSSQTASAGCALPYQISNGQIADASPVMADFTALLNCLNNLPAGASNAIQFNAGNGVLGGVGPLTNGQLLIGSTGGSPQATTLTAGPGITIANSPGNITIGASGSGSDNGSDAPFAAPVLSNMNWLSQGSATAVQDGNYINLNNPSGNGYAGLLLPVSQTSFTITARIRPSPIAQNYTVQGIVLASASQLAGKMQMSTAIFTGGLASEQSYWNQNWGFDHASHVPITYAGHIWLRVVSTPTSNKFYVSPNGRVWTKTNTDNNSWIGAPVAYAGVMSGNSGTGFDANITIDSLQISYP
jgi:hypothetical protein